MFPSVKTLTSRLNLTKEAAEHLRRTYKTSERKYNTAEIADKVLNLANAYLNAYGVESSRDSEWSRYYGDIGLLYVNTGDTYDTTLLYDTRKERFYVTSWGDYISSPSVSKRFEES